MVVNSRTLDCTDITPASQIYTVVGNLKEDEILVTGARSALELHKANLEELRKLREQRERKYFRHY